MIPTFDLLLRHDRPGPRYASFPTPAEFHDGVGETEHAEHLERASRLDAPLSLYVHLPFCEDRCRFCACTVVATNERQVLRQYLTTLQRELVGAARHLGERRRLLQYHVGGGNPTHYSPDELRELHGIITSEFTIEPDAEVVIEADPRATTERHLVALREMGFNQLSLGVQDFTREVQEKVNRIQSFESTRDNVDLARRLGFESINIDLIYGLPSQRPLTFCHTLELLKEIRPDRIAAYPYEHVPTREGEPDGIDPETLPSVETRIELYISAIGELTRAGYVTIGADHFALPDDAQGRAVQDGTLWRNFMGYTVKHAPDVIACGLGGISDVAGGYFQNVKDPAAYERIVESGRLPTERGHILTHDDTIRRHVITSLTSTYGVRIPDIEDLYAVSFWDHFAEERPLLEEMEEEGLVELTPERIELVGAGTCLVRNACMVFDSYLRKGNGKPQVGCSV